MLGKSKSFKIKEVYNMMKQELLKVPPYQRNFVWNIDKQELLIESILAGNYIGQMIFAKSNIENCYDIIDGQQRLKTIFYFIENGFSINEAPLVLTEEEQNSFLNYTLEIYVIDKPLAIDEITNIFETINTVSEPLSRHEIRKIKGSGYLRDIVENLSLQLFPKKEELRLENNTYKPDYKCFWKRFKLFSDKELIQNEDEVILAKIIISVIYKKCQTIDNDILDQAFNKETAQFKEINNLLENYPMSKLISEIKSIFEILTGLKSDIDFSCIQGFYIVFYALFDIVINESIAITKLNQLNNAIDCILSIIPKNSIENLRYDSLIEYAKYELKKCTNQNILISQDIELEEILDKVNVESAGYEFKQGLLDLYDRKKNSDLMERILETLCGMANSNLLEPAFIFIGIADKDTDAKRIAELDDVSPIKIANHYIVGIEREAKILNTSIDRYCRYFEDAIDNSNLSRSLVLSVLSNMNIVKYRDLYLLCIIVPPQNEMSYLGDKVFIRKHSNTVEATNPREIVAIHDSFRNGNHFKPNYTKE